jgi:hypothetical protein
VPGFLWRSSAFPGLKRSERMLSSIKLYIQDVPFCPFFAEPSNTMSGSSDLQLAQWDMVNISDTYGGGLAVPRQIAHLRMVIDRSRAL